MASAANLSAPNVRRIRPPRVLLAMRDRRFMRVTAFLLERRGYAVVQEGGSNVVDAAHRSRVDVVVIEGEASRGTSARTLAALTALPTTPGLISIVDGEAGEQLAGVPAIAKWTPVDELAREIDAVSLRR
jgi:CheY-like chemotaxis protein